MSKHKTVTAKNQPPSKLHQSAKQNKFVPTSVQHKTAISCDIQMEAIIYENLKRNTEK